MSVCISMVTSVFLTKAYLKIAVDLGITNISAYGVKHSELAALADNSEK